MKTEGHSVHGCGYGARPHSRSATATAARGVGPLRTAVRYRALSPRFGAARAAESVPRGELGVGNAVGHEGRVSQG